jgi:hypothetical protein
VRANPVFIGLLNRHSMRTFSRSVDHCRLPLCAVARAVQLKPTAPSEINITEDRARPADA